MRPLEGTKWRQAASIESIHLRPVKHTLPVIGASTLHVMGLQEYHGNVAFTSPEMVALASTWAILSMEMT